MLRRTVRLATTLLVLTGCAAQQPWDIDHAVLGPGLKPGPSAFDVDTALRRMAATPIWPRFEPLTMPLAIWDGRRTLLLRHPHPPATYHSLDRSPEMWAFDGRDGAVTGNSSVELSGARTATMMMSPADTRPVALLAGLAMHELFHVYEHDHHPGWAANEAELFTYPMDDPLALALQRRESAMLQRASAATTPDAAACWASGFLRARTRRFARIGSGPSGYERGNELQEGLAQYVQLRATGGPLLAPTEYTPDAVRQRAYDVGSGLGMLLDRLSPEWRESLDATPDSAHPSLDGLLATVLSRRDAAGDAACLAAADSVEGEMPAARRAVDALRASRTTARARYLAATGWRVVVEAPGAPLFPQRFDPLNVQRISDTEVLHSRFVKLGRDGAMLEVLGRGTLTEGAAGKHPLFEGVRRVMIAGLSAAPSLTDSSGVVVLRAEGVEGSFRGARVTTEGQEVHIILP